MDKQWHESKKFLALLIVLGVILILAVLGIIFHEQVGDLVTKVIAFATSHQFAQGAQDAIAKYKAPAQAAFNKAEAWLEEKPAAVATAGAAAVEEFFDDQDRYANR